METIEVTYTELRNIVRDFITVFSKNGAFKDEPICLRTSINFDLGIDGDDWDEFLYELVEKHNLKLDGFEFYKFFHDEGQISNGLIFAILFLPFVLLRYLIERGWKKQKFGEFFEDRLGDKKDSLSIGDLVVSKLSGKFVKRSQVQVKLVS